MDTLFHGLIGAISGLHSACWGAYKDSIFEKYENRKFIRSIIIGFFCGISLHSVLIHKNLKINLGIFFLVVVTLERILTEWLKAFIRNENQDKYKIPSKFHFQGKVVEYKFLRFTMGIVFLSSCYFLFSLPSILNILLINKLAAGFLWGGIGGLLGPAFGGAWKDAPIEGFKIMKFLRSPLIASLIGASLSSFTQNYSFLLFASIGGERMCVELYKTFIIKSKPGKFKCSKPHYLEWKHRRKKFIVPYIISWGIFLNLLFLR